MYTKIRLVALQSSAEKFSMKQETRKRVVMRKPDIRFERTKTEGARFTRSLKVEVPICINGYTFNGTVICRHGKKIRT